jgi:hypothetical protein
MAYTPVWCAPITNPRRHRGRRGRVACRAHHRHHRHRCIRSCRPPPASRASPGSSRPCRAPTCTAATCIGSARRSPIRRPWLRSGRLLRAQQRHRGLPRGQKVVYGPDALVLAPMARKCLRRLSWRGMRASTSTAASTPVTSPTAATTGASSSSRRASTPHSTHRHGRVRLRRARQLERRGRRLASSYDLPGHDPRQRDARHRRRCRRPRRHARRQHGTPVAA